MTINVSVKHSPDREGLVVVCGFSNAPESVPTNMLYGSRVERRTRALRNKRRSSSVNESRLKIWLVHL